MLRLALVAALAVTLLGCPKNTPTTSVAGTDDEKMDTLSAMLEELHTRADVKCPDWCTLKPKACDLSKQTCDISGRLPDRADFQKKCVAANEECARWSDGCTSCPAH